MTLTYEEGHRLSGWNLIGNPFSTAKTIGSKPFYRMNDLGSEIIAATDPTIAAMEGIFVVATEDGETVTFAEPTKNRGSEERVIINLCNSTAAVIDRAIVRLGEGETLPKLQIREDNTKIYLPQGGKDYAIACAEGQNEMPLDFEAMENGTYTLLVNVDNVELDYLHLIDNLTGADIDLLSTQNVIAGNTTPNPETLIAGEDPQSHTPSYTFQAKTTDYESRFKLVFSSVSRDADDDNAFAFISNGNIIVNGEGTLQIFDALGRQVMRKQLSTVYAQLSTANFPAGVYMIRLINGENVRTQKVVVK